MYLYKNNKPLISYGLICFNKFKINIKKHTYKIILVKRKDTIGYIEFLRGKYREDEDDYIMQLINMMTIEEKKRILEVNDFDKLRELVKMTKKNYIYKNEYEKSKYKFNKLKELNKLEELISKSTTTWLECEWGLPKGRKNSKEHDLQCATREFLEETNLKKEHISILLNIKPLEEEYKGINGIIYKHVYYFCEYNDENETLSINPLNKNQTNEISDLKWFTHKECNENIRDYYKEKKDILNNSFLFLNNIDKEFSIV